MRILLTDDIETIRLVVKGGLRVGRPRRIRGRRLHGEAGKRFLPELLRQHATAHPVSFIVRESELRTRDLGCPL